MKTTFFFWNIKGISAKHLENPLKELFVADFPDILLFAECKIKPEVIVDLSGKRLKPINVALREKRNKKIGALSLFASEDNFNLYPFDNSDNGQSMCNILEAGCKKILLVGVHLPGRLYNDRDQQYYDSRRFRGYIDDIEMNHGHKFDSTLIIGDFNMNPFEIGFVANDGIFAINVENEIASLQNEKAFFNPMASLTGNFIYKSNQSKPPGTYFHSYPKYGKHELHWNVLDGVVMRHNILDCFNKDSLEIVSKIIGQNEIALFDESQNKIIKGFSDHLPVKFSFDFSKPFKNYYK